MMASRKTQEWLASTYRRCDDMPAAEGLTVAEVIRKFFGMKG